MVVEQDVAWFIYLPLKIAVQTYAHLLLCFAKNAKRYSFIDNTNDKRCSRNWCKGMKHQHTAIVLNDKIKFLSFSLMFLYTNVECWINSTPNKSHEPFEQRCSEKVSCITINLIEITLERFPATSQTWSVLSEKSSISYQELMLSAWSMKHINNCYQLFSQR